MYVLLYRMGFRPNDVERFLDLSADRLIYDIS